jgi:hypothetical protein
MKPKGTSESKKEKIIPPSINALLQTIQKQNEAVRKQVSAFCAKLSVIKNILSKI